MIPFPPRKIATKEKLALCRKKCIGPRSIRLHKPVARVMHYPGLPRTAKSGRQGANTDSVRKPFSYIPL